MYVLLIADRADVSLGRRRNEENRRADRRTHDRGRQQPEEKVREAFQQISNELRSQYSIGYTPTNTKPDGTFRKIEIKTKQGLKMQARKGYFGPTKEQQ